MTDMDYEVVQIFYTAYAVRDEFYGKIQGGLDSYVVPLIDMFYLYMIRSRREGSDVGGGYLGRTGQHVQPACPR